MAERFLTIRPDISMPCSLRSAERERERARATNSLRGCGRVSLAESSMQSRRRRNGGNVLDAEYRTSAAPVDDDSHDDSHRQVDVAHATIDDDETTQPSQPTIEQPVEPIVANFDAAVMQAAEAAEEQETATVTQHASTTTPDPVSPAVVAREPVAAAPDAARTTTRAGSASAETAAPSDEVRVRSFPRRLS